MSFFTLLWFSLSLYAAGFPSPRSIKETPELKCDRATIESVDLTKSEMRGKTLAGLITYQVAAQVPVMGTDGKAAGTPADLKAGQKVRVYYVLDKGARVREIDLE